MNNRVIRKLTQTAQNQWVTYLLNGLALVILIGNYLLQSPVFPKEWSLYLGAAVGILNILVEWLSKLPIDS
jgi:uncharacterized membrane protein SirB2